MYPCRLPALVVRRASLLRLLGCSSSPGTEGKEALTQLFKQFDVDTKVVTHIVDTLEVSTLKDFQFLFSNISDVGNVVSLVKDVNVALQVSRVRQAWTGVTQAQGKADAIKKKGDESDDMDALLPDHQLEDLRDLFWHRYHMKYHPVVEPSDYLVSKCTKKLDRRMLTVDDMWAVRSLQHQTKSERKKTNLTGTNFALVETEGIAHVKIPHTTLAYLDCIFTHCLAFARAGCKRLSTAPKTETRATDSCEVVMVPLDVLMAYHDRAKRAVTKMQAYMRDDKILEWLVNHDEEDRARWVDMIRHSEKTLGCIVKQVMEQREVSWDPPEPVADNKSHSNTPKRQFETKQMGDQTPPHKKPKAFSSPGRDPAGSIKTVATRADGQKLCAAWNYGKCYGKKCPNWELHMCNRECRNGRACGMSNHTSADCKNSKRVL